MNTLQFVTESNRIEGILRPPTKEELAEHNRFMASNLITIAELQQFVSVYQPNAVLRDAKGLNVRVGNHFPEMGGPKIVSRLHEILTDANSCFDPFRVHLAYENLHPFTDGNGRSGRALWAWQMRYDTAYHPGLLFLHAWYYQTLAANEYSVGRASLQGAPPISENPGSTSPSTSVSAEPDSDFLWRDLRPDEIPDIGDRFYNYASQMLEPYINESNDKPVSWPGWLTKVWQRRATLPAPRSEEKEVGSEVSGVEKQQDLGEKEADVNAGDAPKAATKPI